MINFKRVLLLALAAISLMSASFIRADYKAPMTIARGAVVSNLIVNKYNDRAQSYRSVVKIVDGCRVIYLGDTYINKYNQMEHDHKNTSIAVSDSACKGGSK